MRIRFLVLGVATAFTALVLAAPVRAQSPADSNQPIEAVWKVQSLDFSYSGLSTAYSCGSLRKRVRSILMRMGAHESIEVRTTACYDLSDIGKVQITMATPVEATPENVQALTQYSSTDQLVARVRGETLGSAADIERFPATWETISLARDKKLKLAPGDCELVQQLQREVLSRMSVRIVDDNVHCSRVFGSYTRPALTVAALVAAPQADARSASLLRRDYLQPKMLAAKVMEAR